MKYKPILKLVPPSPWLQKVVNGIEYWVHVPSRKCGIHIRGLARLCGVEPRAIRSAIQNANKVEGEVGKNYKTELNNLLKDKTIYLEEVGKNSPGKQGGPVKVICAQVCGILIRYYAEKGHEAALKSAVAFMQLGIEQYIFIQVGFIPRPESVVLGEIEYLIAKETVQVNKSRQEEARFFTNPITGECGIDLQSLCFLCGGVAMKHVATFVEAQNEPFLQPEQPEKIVKATVCAATLQHFGEVHKPRKTLAQYWSKALEPIVPTLHQKTHYQSVPKTDTETQLRMQIDELQQENSKLRQLVQNNEVQGNIPWHRLMGRVLEGALREPFWQVLFELEMTKTPQYLDALIIKRPAPLPSDTRLPDGLRADVEIGLLTYKSHQESLNSWSIQELIHHYVGYRKDLAAQSQDSALPEAAQFQLYAVATLYPQALATEMGTAWQPTTHSGVYHLFTAGLKIIVIVTSQIPAAPHNRPWNLLSNDPKLIRYAMEQQALPPDLQHHFASFV